MGLCSSSSGDGIQRMGTFEEVRQWREEVVAYRQRFKQTMERSQALVTRRPDIYCECLESPWKAGTGNYDVGDLFHSTFKKSTVEINMAFKGGHFKQQKAGMLIEMNYGQSIVLCLKSKKSNSVNCACLLAVHSTASGEVFEMIWFATREKYQKQGLGMCLFRRVCQATKAAGAKGLLITASDNVALWWMSLSKDVRALHFHSIVIRNGKSADGLRRAAGKGHDRRIGRCCPTYSTQSAPDSSVSPFYSNPSTGKPFRYGPNLTAHVWYLSEGGGGALTSVKGGKSSKNGKKGKKGMANGERERKGSRYSMGSNTNSPKKRRSFKSAGTTVQASVRFSHPSSKLGR